MNERIRELALQAGHTPLPGFDFANDLQEVFLKKFAELIVKECADIVKRNSNNQSGLAEKTMLGITAIQIKQHFGVEE